MTWNAELYRDKHAFVWQAGQGVLEWLAPQPGEFVLDLGCGTGELTQQIASVGARTLGLDASAEMIGAARAAHPDLEWSVADAREFAAPEPADAVFSNAALHWVKPPEAVAVSVARALRPGGRFVAELGGHGNVKGIVDAVSAAAGRLGLPDLPHPWYFPTIGEYARVLEGAGLDVRRAERFDRPTPLVGEGGFRDWLGMFAGGWLGGLNDAERDALIREAEGISRPALWDGERWVADYVRLRVLAIRPR